MEANKEDGEDSGKELVDAESKQIESVAKIEKARQAAVRNQEVRDEVLGGDSGEAVSKGLATIQHQSPT